MSGLVGWVGERDTTNWGYILEALIDRVKSELGRVKVKKRMFDEYIGFGLDLPSLDFWVLDCLVPLGQSFTSYLSFCY